MSAPRGNQFAKGNRGGGRKGYEFENKELLRMGKFLDRFLTLVEKIESGEATKKQLIIFKEIERFGLKILDKLHSNRPALKEESKKPFLIMGK